MKNEATATETLETSTIVISIENAIDPVLRAFELLHGEARMSLDRPA
jgi:hypothetical protein